MEEAIDVLGKRRTNNPLLVGEPGVGKTAIVEGIAQRLRTSAGAARNRILVELDMASVVAGTQLRGSFSEKLLGIKEEVRRANGRVVVFIDEVHTIMGAGAAGEGPQDAANELKAALARGEFPCIGATTHDEYRQHIEKDQALERRFTPVLVREPSVADTVTILTASPPGTRSTTASRTRPRRSRPPPALGPPRDQPLPAGQGGGGAGPGRLAGAPRGPARGGRARDRAGGRQGGRDPRVAAARQRPRAGARHRGLARRAGDRPRRGDPPGGGGAEAELRRVLLAPAHGSFLLLGPTGVGKTELARALADALYGSRDALVQLDMSECAEQTGVARVRRMKNRGCIARATPVCSAHSDMSSCTSASREPYSASARARASSVLPTPVGPRSRNDPMGRREENPAKFRFSTAANPA